MTSRRWLGPVLALLLALAGVLAVQGIHAPRAAACDCMAPDLDELIERMDLIADVEVVGVRIRDYEGTYRLRVHEVYKGDVGASAVLRTSAHVASCGLGEIPKGERLVIWSTEEDGEYRSTWCDLPEEDREVALARVNELVGPPYVPEPDPQETWTDRAPLLVVSGLLLVGTAVLMVLVKRRRT